MADTRIRDLTTASTPTSDYVIPVDHTSESTAKKITLSQITSLVAGFVAGRAAATVDVELQVDYSSSFANLSYALVITCYDSNGDIVGFKLTAKTVSHFKIVAAADCTVNYIATPDA